MVHIGIYLLPLFDTPILILHKYRCRLGYYLLSSFVFYRRFDRVSHHDLGHSASPCDHCRFPCSKSAHISQSRCTSSSCWQFLLPISRNFPSHRIAGNLHGHGPFFQRLPTIVLVWTASAIGKRMNFVLVQSQSFLHPLGSHLY